MASQNGKADRFSGAKLALFFGSHLMVILRDDHPGLADRACWDFPGGGREHGESPVQCVLRETREEIGLRLRAEDLRWGRGFGRYPNRGWLFVACLPVARLGAVRFGDEGQGWRLMSRDTYLSHPHGIRRLQQRLRVSGACLPAA